VRVIKPPRRESAAPWFTGQSSADSGQPSDRPFDFCLAVQRLMMDIAIRSPGFRHLQTPRILVTATQARGHSVHGLQARVTPLRFAKGALVSKRRGVPYHIQRYFLGEHEYLYLLTFCLPRYLDLDSDQKLVTLFHELYHIGPAFDGDLRRHEGRYHAHSHSKRAYDEHMVEIAREYLHGRPDPSIRSFLGLNFAQLQQRHGAVTAVVVPHPKVVPVP
jgi:predicted metallopeptidase